MKIKTFLGLIALFLFILISLWTLLIFELKAKTVALQTLEFHRHVMVMKADELRHTSDDLTRFVRTYVATKDTKYKENYFAVLDIRNGKRARPEHYEGIYWDILEPKRSRMHALGKAVSLNAEMQKLPYTKNEFQKLKEAEKNSNNLVSLELEAMHAIEGLFKDTHEEFTVHSKPNQQLAIDLLHSQAYHQAKEKIMFPLDEFSHRLRERTSNEVQQCRNEIEDIYYMINILLIFGVIAFIMTLLIIYKKVLQPINIMTGMMSQLKQGNKDLVEPVCFNDEFGMMIHQFFTMKEKLDEDYTAIEKLAHTDPLTKISNRRSFFEMAEEFLKLFKRTDATFSVMMIDIDFFKQVNDTYGHIIGDEILKHLVAQTKGYLRESDLLARYGGEEFIVLLPKTDIEKAEKIAQRICSGIKETPFVDEKISLSITVSIGVAQHKDEQLIRALINRADTALYKAKEMGKNRVELG